jgi:small subunit ribosomal protein S20e
LKVLHFIIIIKEHFVLILNMDAKQEKTKGEENFEEIQRIRMTLKGRETAPLEWACSQIISRSKNKGYETKGPWRMPTKILRVTVRKSPCGEGTNTWDRYEMRIHKRVIDIHCPSSVVKDITTFKIDSSVDVGLIVWKS